MKNLFLILLSFLILSVSTSFAGTFYEPKKKEPKEKAKVAAAMLSESFSHFYIMLHYIESDNIKSAKEEKGKFTKLLDASSKSFGEVVKQTTDAVIKFQDLTEKQKSLKNFVQKKMLKGKPMTEKNLAEIAVNLTDALSKSSTKFQITPKQPGFFSSLRKLIIEALEVQWTGIDVSNVWELSTLKK